MKMMTVGEFPTALKQKMNLTNLNAETEGKVEDNHDHPFSKLGNSCDAIILMQSSKYLFSFFYLNPKLCFQ